MWIWLSIYTRRPEAGGSAVLLYGCLLELLTMQGYYRAIGIVTHPNPGSEALHRAMGFVPVARWEKAGYKLGKWHDVQWFQKQIAPCPAHPRPPVPVTQLDAGQVQELFERYAAQVQM